MDIIAQTYVKNRRDFGTQVLFDNSETTVMNSIPKEEKSEYEWFELIEQTVQLDCIPDMARHEVKAKKIDKVTRGSTHTDGAWPTDIKKYDVNDKTKLRKREKKTETFQQAVVHLAREAEAIVEQNNAIDLFEQYFESKEEKVAAAESHTSKTVAVFRDPNEIKRQANYITWHPEGPNKLAVAYSVLNFQQMPANMPIMSYVWDVNNPNEPDVVLTPQSALVSLEYNPRSPDQLVGGSYNGLVAFWDLRKGGSPVASTVLEQSHHDPVTDIRWIQSRLPHECVSVSTDGRLMWWDTRKLAEGPMDSMWLRENKTTWCGTSLGYAASAGATKYLVGTEQGIVLSVDRKAKKDGESTKSMKVFGEKAGRHHGPIYSIERNSIAPKYFLTIGDWTARVWMEDLRAPIMTTKYDTSYLTGGCWSPTRPGVFFTTKADGTLDIWDYYFKQNDPTFSTKVTDSGLRSIKVQNKGDLVALGAEDGTCTVLQISHALAHPHSLSEEKGSINAMLEREQKREKHLDMQEILRKRDAKAKNKKPEPRFDPYEEDDEATLKILEKVESDFYSQVKIEKPKEQEKEKEKEKEAPADTEKEAEKVPAS